MMSPNVDVATDLIYIARHLLSLDPVPPSFRDLDPNIPSDTIVATNCTAALGALDVDKVIVYPPSLDFRTYEWLRKRGYKIVEVDADEQRLYAPANVMTIEPGLVIMHSEAPNAVAAVRKAGVEVIETPYSEYLRIGGGLHCSTLRLLRDKGPYSTDRHK